MTQNGSFVNITSTDLLTQALDNSNLTYISNLNLCKLQFSEQAVHNMRVNIRRFLAVISLISNIVGEEIVSDLKMNLKLQVKAFNPLRDIQVQLLKLHQLVYTFPVLYKYYHYLLYREESVIDQMKEVIKGFEVSNIEENIPFLKNHICQFFKENNINSNQIMAVVNQKVNEVKSAFSVADRNNLASIHKIRLYFKKFRYMMEITQPLTNITLDELLAMKTFQTTLGNIQDNNVFVAGLEEYSLLQSELSPEMFIPVLNHLLDERLLMIEEFFMGFGRIELFWKMDYLEK